jgi:hypothetical protein
MNAVQSPCPDLTIWNRHNQRLPRILTRPLAKDHTLLDPVDRYGEWLHDATVS